ncbi:MAG: glycosyltransferase [Candidatus Cloacimonetes bacterium]|nr:glycosyltransferase [Candidatus Cloacimonadota bacterium]
MIVDFNELQIITVSFNHSDYLDDYFQSFINVFGKIPCPVFISDNNSSDDSLEIILKWKNKYPKQIFVETNKTNLGFSKANNILVEKSQSKYLLFLNPDVSFNKDFLSPCLEYIEDKKICLSPAFLNPKTHNNYNNFDCFYDNPLYSLKKLQYKFTSPTIFKVDWIQAACLFLHRNHFEEVGGFNEQYFVYTEDMYLSKSLKLIGVDSIIDKSSTIFHPYRKISKEQNKYMMTNLKDYHKEYPIYPYLIHCFLLKIFCFKDNNFITLWKTIHSET